MHFRKKKQATATLPPPPSPIPPRAGRRFLNNTAYLLPKDMSEVNRLDFQHYLLRQALNGNYLAPIESPGYILDVGTGTGRWAKEMAQMFPRSYVIGLDLEQAHATGPIPRNYQFVAANVLERLPLANNTFHFVHQRLLVSAIPALLWPHVIHELVRVTKPGGWVELVEPGAHLVNAGPAMSRIFAWGMEVALDKGIDGCIIPLLGDHLATAGLRNVQTGHADIPLGPWAGRIGTMMQEDMIAGLRAMEAMYATRGYVSDFRDLLSLLPEEYEHYQTHYRFHYFFGQK